MKDLNRKLVALLSSRAFFYVILGFFIFEALWFVASAMYPMPFDEDFHFGVIKIYAMHWSPFLAAQPEGADAFGALARDPSYLFHYIMSFPYRFIALFTASEWAQIIFLRLINVALFAGGLVLFRRLLQRAKTSDALSNTALAIFILIPIVPQLAAHINYDNILMPLVAWVLLLTMKIIDGFRDQKVDTAALLTFLCVCLFTSVIKYAALPILIAAGLFICIVAFRNFRSFDKVFLPKAKNDYVAIHQSVQIVLLTVAGIGAILFAQRYIVNIAQYHNPVPDCGQVLSVAQCKQYGPWGRDYSLAQNKSADLGPNIPWFIDQWWKGMRHRLFFAINGSHASYTNYTELPIPVRAAMIIGVLGLLATLVWWRQVFQGNLYYVLFLLVIVVYIVVLFNDQLSSYKQTGVPVAINGRYLLPILLPFAAIAGTAIASGLRRLKMTVIKPYIAIVAIALFLQGGGLATFIVRSDASWYWPNGTVQNINRAAQRALSPIIIKGDKYADWTKLW